MAVYEIPASNRFFGHTADLLLAGDVGDKNDTGTDLEFPKSRGGTLLLITDIPAFLVFHGAIFDAGNLDGRFAVSKWRSLSQLLQPAEAERRNKIQHANVAERAGGIFGAGLATVPQDSISAGRWRGTSQRRIEPITDIFYRQSLCKTRNYFSH